MAIAVAGTAVVVVVAAAAAVARKDDAELVSLPVEPPGITMSCLSFNHHSPTTNYQTSFVAAKQTYQFCTASRTVRLWGFPFTWYPFDLDCMCRDHHHDAHHHNRDDHHHHNHYRPGHFQTLSFLYLPIQ